METPKKTYRVGDYYLTKNRQGKWCRTWYDESSQQRRSKSLGTSDFQQAKQALEEWFIAHSTPLLDPDLELSRCLLEYWEQHAKHLGRAETEKRNCSYWLEFFDEAKVREIRPPAQRKFLNHLINKGYAKGTIESIFKTGTAAINFAWKNDMLLNPVPLLSPMKELRKHKFEKTPERWRALEKQELIALLDNANTDRLVRFIMVLVACACRPSAAIELEGYQIDLKSKTIDLLGDREQTNKYRPTVKLPWFIEAIYHKDNICSQGKVSLNPDKPMDSIKSSWNTARKNGKLSNQVVPYSVRHTMAKWLRSKGVEAWHTSAQLGHKKKGNEITEIYAPNDPEYLDKAVFVIEEYFNDLMRKSERLNSYMHSLKTWPSLRLRCDLPKKHFEKSVSA